MIKYKVAKFLIRLVFLPRLVLSYSYTIDGLGPSGFDIARSANILKVNCGEGNLTLNGDNRFLLQSPGYPEKPTEDD